MKKFIFPILILIMAVIIIGCSSINETASTSSIINDVNETEVQLSELKVHFIDVGQGDAILLTCGDEAMLVDGGPSKRSDLIYTYLKNNNINYLKYIVATHPDEDHVGGLAGALNYASAGEAFCSALSHDTEAWNDFLKYLSINGTPLSVPKNETTLSLGSATITLYLPEFDENDNSNERSIVTKVVNGETTILLMGDASSSEEDALAAKYDLKCDIVKIAHHGSETSTSEAFIDAINPSTAIISCGAYNDYGHPTDKVLNLLKDKNINLYRTDLNGDVIVSSNEDEISIAKEKEATDPFASYATLYTTIPETTISETTPLATVAETTEAETTAKQSSELTYVLNTSSKKFHYPDCSSVKKMKDKNKETVTTTRDELIANGYSPCGNCHP